MTPLIKIEEFFDNYNFNDQEIQLSPCEKILNLEKFIKSHIKFLKNNKPNLSFDQRAWVHAVNYTAPTPKPEISRV